MRNSVRPKSYRKQFQELVQEYRATGLPWPAEAEQISQWAISRKKWAPRPEALVKRLARLLSRAMRDETHTDQQGRRVRTKHAVPLMRLGPDGNGKQHLFWLDLWDATTKQIHASFQLRRHQTAGDCKNLAVDLDSYNDNHNKGAPIQISFDFTLDVQEAKQPTTYDGMPGDGVDRDDEEGEGA